MNAQKWRLFFATIVIIFALWGLLWIKGEPLPGMGYIFSNIKLGLDIKGGVRLEYKVDLKESAKNPTEVMDDVYTVLRQRLDAAGYTEATLKKAFKESGAFIIVEIPSATDTTQAEKLIGSTGILYFAQILDESNSDPRNDPELMNEARRYRAVWLKGRSSRDDQEIWYLVRKEIMGRKDLILESPNIRNVRVVPDTQKGGYKITFELADKNDIKLFEKITSMLVVTDQDIANGFARNKRLAIVLDNYVQFAGYVMSRIPNGKAEITGRFTLPEAKRLAAILRSGILPARLIKVSSGWVDPTLGKDIIEASLKAGIWGIIIVMVYMVAFYGVMGLVADLALIYNTFLLFGILAWGNIILTLPGIAGIILTIGTTVDGNVIIYERIKEELRSGKTPKTAIAAGFQRSTVTLVDANLTTIIAGLVLYYFGAGTIRGFAITLIIGVIGSLFVNLVFSRLMLEAISGAIRLKKVKGGAEA